MPTRVFSNVHDPRYRFELDRNGVSTDIRQLDPPGDPVAWLPTMWAQWDRSQTTQARAERMVHRLTHERPSSRWFVGKVIWLYRLNPT